MAARLDAARSEAAAQQRTFNGGSATITLIEASGLVAKDTKLFGKGTSDPYVKVLAGDGREVGRTAVVKKSLSPSWNEKFTFEIGPKDRPNITLQLYDHDKIGSDESMGMAVIPLSNLADGTEVKLKLDVQNCKGCKNATGTITVKAQFAPTSVVHLVQGRSLAVGHTSLMVGLGWDSASKSHKKGIDLDASCVMFDRNGSLADAVYYGSLSSKRGGVGAVVHAGDSKSGDDVLGGDDERMMVNLSSVSSSIIAMFFVVTAYTANTYFSDVSRAYMRLLSMPTGIELCRFTLDQRGSHTALVLCRLARASNGSWVMNAVGDIDPQARNYGFLIPRLKHQLKDLVPGVKPKPSDRVSVLRKGQGFKIADCCDHVPDDFTLGLQWDMTNGKEIDLDASCIMLDAKLNSVDLVYFAHLTSNDFSVRHGGDEREGDEKGDDEKMFLSLDRVHPSVSYLGFVINSYSGEELDDVASAMVHLFETATHRDVCVFNLTGDTSLDKHTALVVCVLYRVGTDWYFEAVGEPAQGRTANDNVDELQDFLRRRPLIQERQREICEARLAVQPPRAAAAVAVATALPVAAAVPAAAPAVAVAAAPPAGVWEMYHDENGHPYYYCTTTGESAWELPPGAVLAAAAPPHPVSADPAQAGAGSYGTSTWAVAAAAGGGGASFAAGAVAGGMVSGDVATDLAQTSLQALPPGVAEAAAAAASGQLAVEEELDVDVALQAVAALGSLVGAIPLIGSVGLLMEGVVRGALNAKYNKIAARQLGLRCHELALALLELLRVIQTPDQAPASLAAELKRLKRLLQQAHKFMERFKKRAYLSRLLKGHSDAVALGQLDSELTHVVHNMALTLGTAQLQLQQRSYEKLKEVSEMISEKGGPEALVDDPAARAAVAAAAQLPVEELQAELSVYFEEMRASQNRIEGKLDMLINRGGSIKGQGGGGEGGEGGPEGGGR